MLKYLAVNFPEKALKLLQGKIRKSGKRDISVVSPEAAAGKEPDAILLYWGKGAKDYIKSNPPHKMSIIAVFPKETKAAIKDALALGVCGHLSSAELSAEHEHPSSQDRCGQIVGASAQVSLLDDRTRAKLVVDIIWFRGDGKVDKRVSGEGFGPEGLVSELTLFLDREKPLRLQGGAIMRLAPSELEMAVSHLKRTHRVYGEILESTLLIPPAKPRTGLEIETGQKPDGIEVQELEPEKKPPTKPKDMIT